MQWRHLRQLMQSGLALPSQVRQPVTPEQARALLQRQQEQRGEIFLDTARRAIYGQPASPFRHLLLWAGCDWPDLQQSVHAHGLDGALERLREAGVHLSLAEFKREVPVCRPGLTLELNESAFDNPLVNGSVIEGASSGSRSQPTRVTYTWPFLAEEAAHELMLYAHHGVSDAPVALWYPAPPGIAGVHNLLMDLKRGHAPARWFSQIDPAPTAMSLEARCALRALRIGGRLAGVTVPAPEFADLDHADRVLDWMTGPCVVRGFASSMVRLAERARARGRDLTGAVIFAGGEPLTDSRREFIESTGARVFPRYVATEVGLIAAGCVHRASADDMHVYTDRVALIDGSDGLLLSSLSPHTPKVLLNTNLGDTGTLSTRECDCEFGQLGFTTHLSQVRSQQRLTAEGMTVLAWEFDAVLAAAVRQVGGQADAYQYRQASRPNGLDGIVIAVSPGVVIPDEPAFVAAVYEGLRQRGPALMLAADMWQQAGVLQLVREHPRLTAGSKLPSQARVVH